MLLHQILDLCLFCKCNVVGQSRHQKSYLWTSKIQTNEQGTNLSFHLTLSIMLSTETLASLETNWIMWTKWDFFLVTQCKQLQVSYVLVFTFYPTTSCLWHVHKHKYKSRCSQQASAALLQLSQHALGCHLSRWDEWVVVQRGRVTWNEQVTTLITGDHWR